MTIKRSKLNRYFAFGFAGFSLLAVLRYCQSQMPVQVQPTETPSVATDTRPFDDAEFVAKLKDIATNRNYLSRQFIDGFAASRSYHYQAYLNICKLSNQGKGLSRHTGKKVQDRLETLSLQGLQLLQH